MNLPFLQRLGALSERERRTASIGGLVLAVGLLVLLPLGLQTLVLTRSRDNEALRGALEAIQSSRGAILQRRAERTQLDQRYRTKAPALAGFISEAARAHHVEVSESQDRQAVPHGKKFEERQTVVRLRKSGMLPIAKFLEKLEQSGQPVAVTRLNIRKRSGEADSFDVEVGVSAFDRKETPKKDSAKPEAEN